MRFASTDKPFIRDIIFRLFNLGDAGTRTLAGFSNILSHANHIAEADIKKVMKREKDMKAAGMPNYTTTEAFVIASHSGTSAARRGATPQPLHPQSQRPRRSLPTR
jgi:hypothetical protein